MGQVGFSNAHQLGYNTFWKSSWVLGRKHSNVYFRDLSGSNFINFFFWYQHLYKYIYNFNLNSFNWEYKNIKFSFKQKKINYFEQWEDNKTLLPQINTLSYAGWIIFLLNNYSHYNDFQNNYFEKKDFVFRNYYWISKNIV